MYKLLMTVLVGSIAWAPVAQAAESAEAFFKGKTITYIVSTSPGGGYDTYGRLVARFMNKLMPDSKVIVKNVPGAGHVVGANTIYSAKPDGLTFGTFDTGLIYLQLLKDPAVRFDLNKFTWIGKAATEVRMLVLNTNSGITKVDELLDPSKPKAKLQTAGVGSAGYTDTKLVISALHLNVEIIPGYNGSEGLMSMLRGETQGTIGSQSSYAEYVSQGKGYFAMAIGAPPGGKVPEAQQFAKDDKAKALLKMIAAESFLARLTAGPPGIPADRLQYLREMYMKAMKDPELLEEAKKIGVPIDPADGSVVTPTIAEALEQSPDNIALLAAAVKAVK